MIRFVFSRHPIDVRLQSNPMNDKPPGVMSYAAKLYAYIFVANVLAFVIVVRMGQAVRFHVEHGLRFSVRLSDDCHRSVAVWARGTVKGAAAGV